MDGSRAAKIGRCLLVGAICGMVAACGGGGPASAPQSQQQAPTGRIVQGQVAGAVVFADRIVSNGTGNIELDPDEVSTISDTNGDFAFPYAPGYSYVLVSRGGTDRLTGQPAITLLAPRGAKNISPLTTMVAMASTQAGKNEIIAKINGLGVSYDQDLTQPGASAAAITLSKVLEATIATVTKAVDPNVTSALYPAPGEAQTTISHSQAAAIQAQAAAALAAEMAKTESNVSSQAGLQGVVKNGIAAAASKLGGSPNISILSTESVGNAAASVIAGTVAAIESATGGSAFSTSKTTSEDAIMTPAVADAINTAVESSATAAGELISAAPSGSDSSPLNVTILPADGSDGVPTTAKISVHFNKALDLSTVTASNFILTRGGTVVDGSLSYNNAGKTVTMTPDAPLTAFSTYTFTVTTDVKSLSGKTALGSASVTTFTTEGTPDVAAPAVVSVSPPAGATDVLQNTTVEVLFSKAMDPMTAHSNNVSLYDSDGFRVPGKVSVSKQNPAVVVLTPMKRLAASRTYRIRVKPAIADLSGNTLGAEFTSTFTTAAAADTAPPAVTETIPASGATNINSSTVAIKFSEPLDAATVTTSSVIMTKGSRIVPGRVSFNGTDTITFQPHTKLQIGTTYTVTVSKVADLAGNIIVTYSWSFSTVNTGSTGSSASF